MRFRYGSWKGGPDPEFLKALLDLFQNLLLQMNGDVDRALDALEQLGEQYGFFDDKFDIEAFKKMNSTRCTRRCIYGSPWRSRSKN